MNSIIGFTSHALARMAQMELAAAEVISAVMEPDLAYPGRADRQVRVRGRLAVVVAPSGRTVVTVLWHGREGREAADGQGRSAA